MTRRTIIATILAAATNLCGGPVHAQTAPNRAASDSLASIREESPFPIPVTDLAPLGPPLSPPLEIPFPSRLDLSAFDLSGLPASPFGFSLPASRFSTLSPPPPAAYEFAMPGRDLFTTWTRYRQFEGISIPAESVNAPRMILSSAGYMPLVSGGRHTLGLTGSRQRSPSMGMSNSLSAGYSLAVTDGITLYGNVRISDNIHHLNRFKDLSVSGRMRMRVVDGVWVNLRGTYSVYNTAGPQQMPLNLYPTNSFGGTIEVKITDKVGIEGGAMREYDPFRRRWTTQPYLQPVFY